MKVTRRTLLGALGAAVGVGFAGCSGSSKDDPTAEVSPTETVVDATPTSSPTGRTPTATPINRQDEWCSGYNPPLPVLTENGDQPLSYPRYPSSITQDSALTFAAEHERVIQYNSLLETGYDDVNFSTGTPMFRADETWYRWDSEDERYIAPEATDAEHPADAETYLVRVEGEGAAWDRQVPEGQTARPHYDIFNHSVWYEITEPTAWRMFVEQEPDEFPPSALTFTNETQLVCESES